jgi:hypothetical protein
LQLGGDIIMEHRQPDLPEWPPPGTRASITRGESEGNVTREQIRRLTEMVACAG